jgi:hypothetical protein
MRFFLSNRLAYRQRMVEYRARFDTNMNVQDLMKAKRLLISGEEELKKAMYWHTENFNCKLDDIDQIEGHTRSFSS